DPPDDLGVRLPRDDVDGRMAVGAAARHTGPHEGPPGIAAPAVRLDRRRVRHVNGVVRQRSAAAQRPGIRRCVRARQPGGGGAAVRRRAAPPRAVAARPPHPGDPIVRVLPAYVLASMFVLPVVVPARALAQRADANVVAEAEDAFGLSLSGQSVGLYNSRNIRNSDPVQLGNLRLDGLYFDRQGAFTTQLIGSTAIRVGGTIIELPFPAPAGIVDFRIRDVPAAD